jgi:hydroxymethylpyrimidine/phosphomethylpyrimidine kinase
MADQPVARALTIAGSDSSGGAGIQADLKTFTALEVYGMTAITALTAQNTIEVAAVHPVPADFVAAQIDSACSDIGVDAAKTGMLFSKEIIEAVAAAIQRHAITKIVVDPVMIATSGAPLLEENAGEALKDLILPLAHIITPNIPEAEVLTGLTIKTEADMTAAAKALIKMGPRHVLIKGGHLESDEAPDILLTHDGDIQRYTAPRIATRSTRGTGCTYAAAITAGLAKGLSTMEAIAAAKTYITSAIQHSLNLGEGGQVLKS